MADLYQDNWNDLFASITGYSWAYVGIGLALGTSIAGAAWYMILFYRKSLVDNQKLAIKKKENWMRINQISISVLRKYEYNITFK